MEEENPTTYTTIASGWVSKPPACLIKGIGEATLTAAEINYYFALGELFEENKYGCIGTGIGSGINNTNELKVLSFDKAMALHDKDNWQASVDREHGQILKNSVWGSCGSPQCS